MIDIPKISRFFLFAALGVFLFWSHAVLIAHADVYVSSTQGLWHFSSSSSTQDSAGNNYALDGSAVPNTTASFVSTDFHDAFDDASHQYVYTSATPNFYSSPVFSQYSVFAWVYPTATSGNHRIFSDADQDSIVMVIINGKLYCQLYVQGSGVYSLTGNTTINNNQKYLVGCVWDGSYLHAHVDSLNDDVTPVSTATGNLRNGTSHLYVGEGAGNTEQFTGQIDELLLTNSALSSSTITSLYNGGSGGEVCLSVGCDTPSLIPSISTSTPLAQYQSNGTTAISAGGSTPDGTVIFSGGLLSSSSTDNLQLQVEVEPSSTSFVNAYTALSTTVTSGHTASTTVFFDANGAYHWQARALDTDANSASSWQVFGGPTDYLVAFPTSSNMLEISDGSIRHIYHFNDPASSTDSNNAFQQPITFFGSSTDPTNIASNLNESKGSSTWAQTTTDSFTPYLNFAGADFSFAVWVEIPSTLGGRIISFADQDNFVLADNSSHFYWQMGDNSSHYPTISSNLTTATGITYFVAGTWDHTTGQMVLYINDATDTILNGSATGDMRHGASHLYFGTGASNTENYHGRMDEVVFSNTKWTADQLAKMYNHGLGTEVCVTAGCGGPRIESGTLSQYKSDATSTINEGSSTTESTVVFGGTLNSNGTSTLQLQVEVTTSTTFSGSPNVTSSWVSPGSEATATLSLDPESWSNGNYHWQARVEESSTDATSSWQWIGPTATSTDFVIHTVPEYMQKYGPWPSYSNATDAGTGWWHDQLYDGSSSIDCEQPGGTSSTIGYCGCSITSVVMWLRYSGVTTDTLGEDINPGTLNTWLTNHGGYDSSFVMVWGAVEGYASSTSGSIVFDASSTDYDGASASVLRSYVDSFLSSSTPDPVVLNEIAADHFVIATGFAQNAGTSTYTVRDSAYYNTQYLNQATSTDPGTDTVYNYNNHIDGARVFYDPPQAPPLIEYHVRLPDTMMLVDSQGRRTGKDPATGTIYREIPGAHYAEDGLSPTNRAAELFVSGVAAGQYTLHILGGETGPYGLYVWNNKGSPQTLSGSIEAGTMATYGQDYDPANLASSTLVFQGTVSSTASINSAPPKNLPLPLIPAPARKVSTSPTPPFYPVIPPSPPPFIPATSTPASATSTHGS